MNAQGMQDQFKDPSKAITDLQAYCKAHDLSYEIINGGIRITLPSNKHITYREDDITQSLRLDLPDPTDQPDPDEDFDATILEGSYFDDQGWPTSPVDESGHDPMNPLTEGEPPEAL